MGYLPLTLGLMAIGTVSIACTPSYASIGLMAPLLVVAGRLVQGLSAGVELGGVSVYLSEIATPGHKGFYVSWQSASQQVAVMFAAVLGLLLTMRLSTDQMTRWGWRIPLLDRLHDYPAPLFVSADRLRRRRNSLSASAIHRPRHILRTLARYWRLVVLGTMLSNHRIRSAFT